MPARGKAGHITKATTQGLVPMTGLDGGHRHGAPRKKQYNLPRSERGERSSSVRIRRAATPEKIESGWVGKLSGGQFVRERREDKVEHHLVFKLKKRSAFDRRAHSYSPD